MTKEEIKECLNHLDWLEEDIKKSQQPGYLLDIKLCREALENEEILLDLLSKVDSSDLVCDEISCTEYCEKNCTSYDGPKRECYLEYCRVKREEKND